MKLGVNLLCETGFVDDAQLPLIARAAELGYDGVEVPVFEGTPEHYAALGRRIAEHGLARTSTSIVPGPEVNPLDPDPEVRARGRAHLDWALDCAAALGAESMGGPFHAPIGHFTGEGPSEGEIARAADELRRLAERAEGLGLYLSLEPLNRFETHFLNTAAQAKALVDRVGHPAFRIMYDTFHAHIEERSQAEAIATLAGHIGVLHVAENDRGIPGRGQIDFAGVFRAVRATGFDGWVVIEAFGRGVPELAAATRVWRPLFPDTGTLLAEGAELVRRTWAGAAP